MPYVIHRFINAVCNENQFQVFLRYRPLPDHPLDVFEQGLMVFPAEQNNGELGNGLGLNQGECFEQFIERAETPGHNDECIRIFDKQNLTDKEMFECNGTVGIWISLLLKGELDVTTDGFSIVLVCPAIGCFHNAGATTRKGCES